MDNTEQVASKLWNRNFSLLVIGQIISVFGNMVLNFALPLYILDVSGSPALFGVVVGLPFVSLLILSPIGGIMADRLKKQRILFWLDVTATGIVVLYMLLSGLLTALVPIVIVKLLALNAVQGMYMPTVEASIPALVPSERLVPANSVIGSINALSNLAAPAVAGILLGRFGLFPILIVGAVCFALTAIMDLMIRIPYKKQQAHESIVKMVKSDMSQAFHFAVREEPILAKLAVIMFLFIMTIAAVILVGLPVLITQALGMDMEYAGMSKGISVIGVLIGSAIAGALGERLTINRIFLPIFLCCMTLIPIGLVFLFDTAPFTAYVIITAASTLTFMTGQLFQIPVWAYIQKVTPTELVGKVFSLVVIFPFLANGLGHLLFGALFEQFYMVPWLVIFVAAFLAGVVALYSRKHFNIVAK